MSDNREKQPISQQTLRRLPYYLDYLKSEACGGMADVSAGRVADALDLTEIQVRKDLAAVSEGGRPRLGFDRLELISDIETFLGFNNVDRAVLVGAGRLGQALMHFEGCRHCGVEIVAAFDSDPAVVGQDIGGIRVIDIAKLNAVCRRLNVHIGIITVPAPSAQAVCDSLVDAGVLAIWNFALAKLKVPDTVLLHSENMSVSLTLLSHHLAQRLNK